MHHFGWKHLLVVCSALLAMAPVAGQAPPPVEAFFANNAFAGAVLSPSGRYLAVRTGRPGRRDALAVIDLETGKPASLIGNDVNDVAQFQWVNDTRLIYNVRDRTIAPGTETQGPGVYGIDVDGGHFVRLADPRGRSNEKETWLAYLFDQQGPQDTPWRHVLLAHYDRDGNYDRTYIQRIDTKTAGTDYEKTPAETAHSYLLDFQGKLRLAISSHTTETVLRYRHPTTNAWSVLARYAESDTRAHIQPIGFGPDGTLYVIANAGANLATLRTLDIATGKLSKEALVATPGYDFDGTLVYNRKKVLGVRLTTDAEANVWFDPAMQAIQNAVNKALPGTVNLLTVAADPDAPRVLVESYSDRHPRTFSLYNIKTGQLELSAAPYPLIEPAAMGRQEPVRYQARDGLAFPGLLTLPPGGQRKDLPMVVLVHGGPWVRGSSWGWDPESQFLASRGYAVLEVQFRGSTGLGAAHLEAGFRQWGLAMQDDVADGTRWAIAQGIADPKRICIAGASYGGYATLMGLVNNPELFRCGIAWVGVTDIELMYTRSELDRADFNEGALTVSMPRMIGDPVKDVDQLRATSPLRQAARIKQPVLLAYGREDRRVPIVHGNKLWTALSRTNKQVEWVDYPGEGHGWSQASNRIDFWRRVDSFLYRQIGTPPATTNSP
jgi:dipeptidyl aminopeptidase/acylaminoacyl peptidase